MVALCFDNNYVVDNHDIVVSEHCFLVSEKCGQIQGNFVSLMG